MKASKLESMRSFYIRIWAKNVLKAVVLLSLTIISESWSNDFSRDIELSRQAIQAIRSGESKKAHALIKRINDSTALGHIANVSMSPQNPDIVLGPKLAWTAISQMHDKNQAKDIFESWRINDKKNRLESLAIYIMLEEESEQISNKEGFLYDELQKAEDNGKSSYGVEATFPRAKKHFEEGGSSDPNELSLENLYTLALRERERADAQMMEELPKILETGNFGHFEELLENYAETPTHVFTYLHDQGRLDFIIAYLAKKERRYEGWVVMSVFRALKENGMAEEEIQVIKQQLKVEQFLRKLSGMTDVSDSNALAFGEFLLENPNLKQAFLDKYSSLERPRGIGEAPPMLEGFGKHFDALMNRYTEFEPGPPTVINGLEDHQDRFFLTNLAIWLGDEESFVETIKATAPHHGQDALLLAALRDHPEFGKSAMEEVLKEVKFSDLVDERLDNTRNRTALEELASTNDPKKLKVLGFCEKAPPIIVVFESYRFVSEGDKVYHPLAQRWISYTLDYRLFHRGLGYEQDRCKKDLASLKEGIEKAKADGRRVRFMGKLGALEADSQDLVSEKRASSLGH